MVVISECETGEQDREEQVSAGYWQHSSSYIGLVGSQTYNINEIMN